MTDGSGGPVDTAAAAEPRNWGRWFGRPGRSLTRRLIWLASAWIVLALVLTGWALTNQYQESALRRLGNVLSDTIDEVVLSTNAASRRVVEKAGFRYERQVTHAGGPHLLYRLTAPAWHAAPRAPATRTRAADVLQTA